MNHPADDPLAELEARLRAWRPAALPLALHARLLAAEPPPPRRAWHRSVAAGALALVLASGAGWWLSGGGSGDPSPVRRTPPATRLVDAAWTPGASLTMNLATGVSAGKVPAPWRLDAEGDAADGLFSVRSADGKLLLKVDCQF